MKNNENRRNFTVAKRRNFYHRHPQRREKHYCEHQCEFDKCDVCHEKGELVEKVICSENVQRTAEFALPFTVEPGPAVTALMALLPNVTNAVVTPDYSGIQQEITVLRDKVIHFGYIPATIDVTGTVTGLPANPRIPIRILFQEHTDCPGVCPEDHVIESQPEIEAVLNEPLIGTGANGTSLNLLLFKAVIRSHLTIVRKGIERDGKICDLDYRRCDHTNNPGTINSPLNLSPNLGKTANMTPPTPPPAT